MRGSWLPSLVLGLSLGGAGRAAAAEDLRAVIERAVQAQGGEEQLSRMVAVRTRVKGTMPRYGLTFTGETFFQQPDQQREVLEVELKSQERMAVIQVLRGGQAWCTINGQREELDAGQLKRLQQETHADRVSSLVPLLREKGFTLSALGEARVEGRDAVGVRVSSRDQRDVDLYFDKASGLLVKRAYPKVSPHADKTVTSVCLLADYRVPDPAAADERTLQAVKLPSDGAALLQFLRKRTLTDADRDRIAGLVRQLGDNSFAKREQASADLVALGSLAVPFLRHALDDADLEITHRAGQCLQHIGKGPDGLLPAAVTRLVALRKPAGAAEVLLAYLPYAPDEGVAREVRAALAAVAFADGKPDPFLTRARDDGDPVRRAAAVEALGRGTATGAPRRVLLDGLKQPMKITVYEDDQKTLEYEVLEVHYFDHLDDRLFARP